MTWSAVYAESWPPLKSPWWFGKHMLPALRPSLPFLGTVPYSKEATWLACFFFHSRLNL